MAVNSFAITSSRGRTTPIVRPPYQTNHRTFCMADDDEDAAAALARRRAKDAAKARRWRERKRASSTPEELAAAKRIAKERWRAWYDADPKRAKQIMRKAANKYTAKNHDAIAVKKTAGAKAYRLKNAAKIKAYRERNRERELALQRLRRQANPEKRRRDFIASLPTRARYTKRLRQESPQFLILTRLRAKLQYAFSRQGMKKTTATMALCGCDSDTLYKHIESQFKPGMTWENRRAWHVDHIVPIASFDLRCPLQQVLCFHFSNLRPLWAHENLSRINRVSSD